MDRRTELQLIMHDNHKYMSGYDRSDDQSVRIKIFFRVSPGTGTKRLLYEVAIG